MEVIRGGVINSNAPATRPQRLTASAALLPDLMQLCTTHQQAAVRKASACAETCIAGKKPISAFTQIIDAPEAEGLSLRDLASVGFCSKRQADDRATHGLVVCSSKGDELVTRCWCSSKWIVADGANP